MPGSHIERYRYIFIHTVASTAGHASTSRGARVARVDTVVQGCSRRCVFCFYIIYLNTYIETVKQLTVRTPPTTPRKYRSVQ